jgi:Rrf2 family protein
MLSASRKVDLAFVVMASLPEPGEAVYLSIQDIAAEKELSPGFLSQIVLDLKKARLVTAKEGLYGGYQLAKPSTKILLSDIYEAIEGPLTLTTCQSTEKNCICEHHCNTKTLWSDLQALMNSYLQTRSLVQFKTHETAAA